MSERDHEDIQYLMQDNIGLVLAEGISEIFKRQPQFPIDFFAKWLLNYQATLQKQENLNEKIQKKIELQNKFSQAQKIKEEKEKQIKDEQEYWKSVEDNFVEKMMNHEYHYELLKEELPNFICSIKNFTGCYIGELDFPNKQIDENDDEENSHLDQNQQKLIKYIGFSNSSSFLENQTLPLDLGITAQVFQDKQQQQEAENEENEEDQQQQDKKKKEYLYIPDVVADNRIHFFQIPKLGAYMAISLTYYSCLSDSSFQGALEERLRVIKAREEQEQIQLEINQMYQDQIREKEEQGEDPQEIIDEWEERKKTFVDIVENEFWVARKDYVLCMDTMGQDKEISDEDRDWVEKYAKQFVDSWEQNEKKALEKDIEMHIQYLNGINNNPKEVLDRLYDEEEKNVIENDAYLDEFKEKEKELGYEQDCLRLEKVKQQIFEDEIKNMIIQLKEYRVIRFQGIAQALMLFLGYMKETINIEGQNNLNWKKARNLFSEEEILFCIKDYNHKGPKPQETYDYAKLNRISKRIEKYNIEEVENYHIGYGRLLRWFQLTLKLRKLDIELRREMKEKQKAERESKIQENERITNEKLQALEGYKTSLPPEELESFNEEDWLAQYEDEHPLHEIPDEIIDDVDLDWED